MTCDLCGLHLRFGSFSLESSGNTYSFCCQGCRQVFQMLVQSSAAGDPTRFKETELFQRCLEMGIIPGSEEELRQRSSSESPTSRPETPDATPPSAALSAKTLQLNLQIDGMWCPACAWVIDETVKRIPGVIDTACHFSTDRLRCRYDPVQTSPDRIAELIQKLGYRAGPPGEEGRRKQDRREFIRFAVSAFLTMNVMMLSFALYSGFFSEMPAESIAKLSWPILFMATVVMVYGGRNIFRRALTGLYSAAASMEALIAVGSSSAYLYGVYNFFQGGIHLYFDTAAMLITLVLLGKLLERNAKNRVLEDLEAFFSIQPSKVRICTPGFPEGRYQAASMLQPGDIFQVEEGEILPADGLAIEGDATLDESALTGEARPLHKRSGDHIRSGGRVLQGKLRIRAAAVGADSVLGQMIQIMENALDRKTPFEGKTDRILRWFVPLIIALAAGTGIVSRLMGLSLESAVIRAVTVCVISCPCALGVAIPLARVAGISVASRLGILVREFSSFEMATRVDTFVFDKTGTLTRGQWELLHIEALGVLPTDQVLALAAALEETSDHQVAVEIKRTARHKRIAPLPVQSIQIGDAGILGRFNGKEVKIGSRGFLQREIDASPPITHPAHLPSEGPVSMVYMSFDGRICAQLVFGDEIRKGARKTVQALVEKPFHLYLVSGDGSAATRTVADALDISKYIGDQLPWEKADTIEELRTGSRCVAMVGDGVNDAPAMAKADLAIAVHSGSPLGKEVAGITLMRGEPSQILDFLRLAQKTNRKVQQNLGCAFVYNAVSIPVAMSGLLNPLVAVCAMLLSSLSVIGNTLLLVRSCKEPGR